MSVTTKFPPKISVVIPTYNGENTIAEAIDSIINQTFTHWEMVVVDDASTDKTWGILQSMAEKDTRIRLLKNEKNCGIAVTRNKGLQVVHGTYYAVMDQDDVSLPKRFEKQYAFLEENKEYGAIGCQVDLIDINNVKVGHRGYPLSDKEIVTTLPIMSPFCNPATMIRTEAIKRLGLYDTCYPGSEEYDLWFSLVYNKYKLANLKETLFLYRISENQAKNKKTKILLFNTLRIKRKWIFTAPYLNIKNTGRFLAEVILLILPNFFIQKLFTRIYYVIRKS